MHEQADGPETVPGLTWAEAGDLHIVSNRGPWASILENTSCPQHMDPLIFALTLAPGESSRAIPTMGQTLQRPLYNPILWSPACPSLFSTSVPGSFIAALQTSKTKLKVFAQARPLMSPSKMKVFAQAVPGCEPTFLLWFLAYHRQELPLKFLILLPPPPKYQDDGYGPPHLVLT